MNIVLALLTLALMIVIHEFGHFITAKILKVPVYEFSVGMGPKIFSIQGKKETKYSLRWFPIGGFCSFDKGDVTGIQDSALNQQPIWKRVIILFGGSTFNLVSAFIAAILLCSFIGLPGVSTTIYDIADERADSFLMPEDKIIAVNGTAINEFEDITKEFEKSDGTVNITVLREGEEVSSDIALFEYEGEWKMGATMYNENYKVPITHIIPESFHYCTSTAYSIVESFAGLFTGKVHISEMSGIVGIVAVMGSAAKQNICNIITYFILISIDLGILNLMPIPVLDGSKIIFCAIEFVFSKKIPEKVEEALTMLFGLLLMILMLYTVVHDISMLIP